MNIITDKTKAPAKLRYRVSNNSGSINKEFGKNQQAAYYGIKEQMISMFSYRINKDKRFSIGSTKNYALQYHYQRLLSF